MAKESAEKTGMLIKQEKYLEAGLHIGTRMCTFDMQKFVFRRRDDGLHILDLREIDRRIRKASKIMGNYNLNEILIVASRTYSGNAALKFCELTGAKIIKGRFIPGTMTNVKLDVFCEPKLIFVCDPKNEKEAIIEAGKAGIPIIALSDSDNEVKYIDFIIPANNKGRKSLALIFCILARELLMIKGKISSYNEFKYEPSYFEELEEREETVKKKETEP